MLFWDLRLVTKDIPSNSPICFSYRYIGLCTEIEKLTSSAERISGFVGSSVVCTPDVVVIGGTIGNVKNKNWKGFIDSVRIKLGLPI